MNYSWQEFRETLGTLVVQSLSRVEMYVLIGNMATLQQLAV